MRAAVFLTFWVGTLLKWKSATAAALITIPAGPRFSMTFSRISAAALRVNVIARMASGRSTTARSAVRLSK